MSSPEYLASEERKKQVREAGRRYEARNQKTRNEKCLRYYYSHAAKMKGNLKQWRKNNKEKLVEYYAQPHNHIAYNLRRRVVRAIKDNQKSGHTLELLGCSISALKQYLESLFKPGMSWENYGPRWHIDHVKPCAAFNLSDPTQQRACFNYKNLQPLFAFDNLSKGDKWTIL